MIDGLLEVLAFTLLGDVGYWLGRRAGGGVVMRLIDWLKIDTFYYCGCQVCNRILHTRFLELASIKKRGSGDVSRGKKGLWENFSVELGLRIGRVLYKCGHYNTINILILAVVVPAKFKSGCIDIVLTDSALLGSSAISTSTSTTNVTPLFFLEQSILLVMCSEQVSRRNSGRKEGFFYGVGFNYTPIPAGTCGLVIRLFSHLSCNIKTERKEWRKRKRSCHFFAFPWLSHSHGCPYPII